MKELIGPETNIFDSRGRVGMRNLADVRNSSAAEDGNLKEPVGELVVCANYFGEAERVFDLRDVVIGEAIINISSPRKSSGNTKPVVMAANLTGREIVELIGPSAFNYGNGMLLDKRRGDCPCEVVTEILKGSAQLGLVSNLPQDMNEHVGILAKIDHKTEDGKTGEVYVLGRISSPINR